MPAIFGAASAFGAPKGAVSGALTYSNPRGGIAGNAGDAELGFGLGLGNPIRAIGVSLGVDVTGTQPLGDAGSFSIAAFRALSVTDRSLTFGRVGATKLGGWGTSKNLSPDYDITLSHFTTIGSVSNPFPVMISVGYATDNTYSNTAIGTLSDGAFVGAGVGLSRNLSVSASATQTQANIGASMTIPGVNGVSLSVGVYDVSNSVQRRQTAVTIGYSLTNIFGQ